MELYTKEQLKQIQRKSLDIAKYFVSFCQEHDLLCYFCGGGCIGAIRHKGFIPWDDDLDFFMPREEYQKMILLWEEKENKKYILSLSNINYLDKNLFVTIRDKDTTMIKPYQKDLDICHGIAIDIFPLDGYPDKLLQRKKQCIYALLFSLYRSQVIPEKHGKVMTLGSKILLSIVPSKKLRYKLSCYFEKKMSQYSIDDCEYITELCAGPKYMQKKYPKSAFLKALFVDFEDSKMPIPIGYDAYLTEAFGDYMQLPDEKDQIPHHDILFMDLTKGFENYKGKHYCCK